MPVSSSIKLHQAEQNALKRLVRQVLSDAVVKQSLCFPAAPQYPALLVPAACFVTLYRAGQLRGCIGTYAADQALWFNVCRYSYYSAFEDRRFPPLSKQELDDIHFEISVLSELEAIPNEGEQALLQQLQVGKDGLLLKEKARSAIFLPSVWHSLSTPLAFLQALKHKGGWAADYWSANMELFKFSTFTIAGAFRHNQGGQ
ncbi:MAG: AmmeMemoRadiSam system protein A [Psychromonas sp.]|nr:AmmeMemoRadiSam system protein A [Psychromonas sp.]